MVGVGLGAHNAHEQQAPLHWAPSSALRPLTHKHQCRGLDDALVHLKMHGQYSPGPNLIETRYAYAFDNLHSGGLKSTPYW